MSTHPTFADTTTRTTSGINLLLAQAQLEQALRVAELAHSGAYAVLRDLPDDASVRDVRERTLDSLVLFGQALRLVTERHQEARDLAGELVTLE